MSLVTSAPPKLNMPVGIQLLIAFAVGGLLGFFFGWLKGRGRAAVPDSRLENELRQQVGQRETELARLRAQLTETGNAARGGGSPARRVGKNAGGAARVAGQGAD
jgi:hypothetical protein